MSVAPKGGMGVKNDASLIYWNKYITFAVSTSKSKLRSAREASENLGQYPLL